MCCETDTGDSGAKPVRLSSCLAHELRLTIGTYQQREGQQLLSPDRVRPRGSAPAASPWLDAVLLGSGSPSERNWREEPRSTLAAAATL